MKFRCFLPIPLALLLAGCVVEGARTGPARNEPWSVERDDSSFLRVNLNMAAGDLRVGGGTDKFLEGNLLYNVDAWKPVLRYTTAAGHGNITIDQPGTHHGHIGNVKYRWDLRLADNIPIDLAVRFGAGDASLRIGSLSLRTVNLEMGVGHLEMDLRGSPKRDYEVRIRGGVGEATIRLPRDVGVAAKAEGGIGAIQTSGLRREAGRWVNPAYDDAKVTIHLDVRGGIGAINLISD
jgi:hypothetical protein